MDEFEKILDLMLSADDSGANVRRLDEIEQKRIQIEADFIAVKQRSAESLRVLKKEREQLETANDVLLAGRKALLLELMNSMSHRRYCQLMGY